MNTIKQVRASADAAPVHADALGLPSDWTVRPFEGALGAEVLGLDARRALDVSGAQALRTTLALRGVVVLPNQQLTDAEQVAFSASLGPIEAFGDQTAIGNAHPNIFRVSNRGDGLNVGHYWHMDASTRQKPTAISTLYAVDVSASEPTETLFLDAAAAYAGLTAEQQQRIDGQRWMLADRIPAPVVRAHPLTGQPLLWLPMRFPSHAASAAELKLVLEYLNRDIRPRIDGFEPARSEQMLLELVRHLTSHPEWLFRHEWKKGDLVLWDQAAVYHHAGDSKARRELHRTAVRGVPATPYAGVLQAHAEAV